MASKTSAISSEDRLLGKPARGWRRKAFEVIFEADTPAGRRFDLVLLAVIVASVVTVMLDSVSEVGGRYALLFDLLEWGFTLLFTLEYALRIACVERRARYVRSFFGVVDLLAVLPTLIDIRMLRLLRALRILKLTAYVREYRSLGLALAASRRKILVFIGTVAIVVTLLGTVMYVVEGPANGFTSVPVAVYWAISTMTTVGFGDITPKTDLGRAIASLIMLLGWGILAVPTGIVTAEMTSRRLSETREARSCEECGSSDHSPRAKHCAECGAPLPKA
jgi:voltage-gated potassium channel